MAIQGPPYRAGSGSPEPAIAGFTQSLAPTDAIGAFPLIVVVDDSAFTAASLRNFLWVTFTRSNPAADIDGIGSFIEQKHWGCRGPLVIDARLKPHHAPPLEDDPEIARRVNGLGAPGGPLHGVI
jgi:4-hydroxy-3-polyprenylbenzoate decarboxylase